MIGANTTAAVCPCPEYAEVDPTGRYGRVWNRRYHCKLLLSPFFDPSAHRSADPFPCTFPFCLSQFSDVLGKGASKIV
jgi:hypothetical protein